MNTIFNQIDAIIAFGIHNFIKLLHIYTHSSQEPFQKTQPIQNRLYLEIEALSEEHTKALALMHQAERQGPDPCFILRLSFRA